MNHFYKYFNNYKYNKYLIYIYFIYLFSFKIKYKN